MKIQTEILCDWYEVDDALVWDRELALLNGHPLQSAKWGEARREVDGLDSLYLMFKEQGNPLCMARVEIRKLPLLGKVAWMPRGPVMAEDQVFADFDTSLQRVIGNYGFCLMITDEYKEISCVSRVRTIWIDLTQALDVLIKRIDKQWLYGTRKAVNEGVKVVLATSVEEVSSFYQLCDECSRSKGFHLPGTEALMQELMQGNKVPGLEMHLFLAKHEERIGAGIFVARSGNHVHFFWGATDRNMSKYRVGEAVQWAVIDWARAQGCTRYDLEGIDPANNPGVYKFKKKMGGDEISLKGNRICALTSYGRIAGVAGKIMGIF